MLILASGFALASTVLPFGGFTSNTVNGNQGSIQTANTIYSPGLSSSVYETGTILASDCSSTATATGNTPVTVSADVAGGAGACSGVADYVLQLTFQSTTSLAAGTYLDEFVVTSEFGTNTLYTTSEVNISCTLSTGPGQCLAQINIDTGFPITGDQPSVNVIEVTVTGN